MKRRVAIFVALCALGLMGLIGITCIKPPCGHYDFNLRMNEIACVVSGVNPFLWVLFALSLPVLSRVFLAWHGLCAFFGWEFPISGYAFRCVDSLNSTASLAIAFSFCAWRRRELECGIIRTTDT